MPKGIRWGPANYKTAQNLYRGRSEEATVQFCATHTPPVLIELQSSPQLQRQMSKTASASDSAVVWSLNSSDKPYLFLSLVLVQKLRVTLPSVWVVRAFVARFPQAVQSWVMVGYSHSAWRERVAQTMLWIAAGHVASDYNPGADQLEGLVRQAADLQTET